MRQSFEYLKVVSSLDSITVENIGNVILEATNDLTLKWYLSIITTNGLTQIKEFGPIFRDIEITKYGFNFNIQSIGYDEKKLCKIISTFVNNPKREITQVYEIDECELDEQIKKVVNIVKDKNEI